MNRVERQKLKGKSQKEKRKESVKSSNLIFVFCLFSFAFFSCKEKECKTSSSLSYSADIQPIFNESCAIASCHNSSSKAGSLDLSAANSYTQLTKAGSGYVNVANPTSSIIYTQMNSTNNPMPPAGKLNNCTIDKIIKWIEQGAKNN